MAASGYKNSMGCGRILSFPFPKKIYFFLFPKAWSVAGIFRDRFADSCFFLCFPLPPPSPCGCCPLASQLDNTDLDRKPDNPGSYKSGLGGLNSTDWGDDEISSNYSGDMGVTESDINKYNWGNDGGTQFERWDDPYADPCMRDENVTGEDGLLYEVDSSGRSSGDPAHTDIKGYIYHKGYCTGHPAPEIEYVDCDCEEECDCDEIKKNAAARFLLRKNV